jgi:predicted Zn finger-like uncharacterized protein
VIVECARCGARYSYDDARFAGKPSKKLRCSKCETIFEVFAPPDDGSTLPLTPRVPEETRRRWEASGEAPPRPPAAARRPPGTLRMPADLKLSLAVIAGPDAGKIFPIERPRIVIGREEVDFALEDPEISRHHAAIEVCGEQITLVDLGSTNGTLIGEEPVQEAPLENQGEFTIGASTLMLIVTPA